ncbi:MAG: hypothetical protein MK538_03520 [Planctomycetes bacterium]|nr:hypothetical protein [Planctomycetota bacterium]
MRTSTEIRRQSGVAMLVTMIMGVGLMMLTTVSVDLTMVTSVTRRVQRDAFVSRQIADSGASQALAKIKEGGIVAPFSGSSASPAWVPFSTGDYYYYTNYDPANGVSTIRAWGKVAVAENPSTSIEAPDNPAFDSTGWMVQGIEITVKSYKYIPEAPLYFGNGGMEKPKGGFSWSGGSDPADPSTWSTVSSGSQSSYQSSSVPFEASALDHPTDFIYNGGTPAAAGMPHPYNIWASQNPIGQFNVEAWFNHSAGTGNDPTVMLTPPPTSSYYDTSDKTSPDYPYPVDPDIPDVQSFAHKLWNTHSTNPDANLLNGGRHSGEYGDMANPAVTFVTGTLQVNSRDTFRGAGVLVIRDNYDPNVDSNNQPSKYARLLVKGTFEWTGLVIIAGWKPSVEIRYNGNATIVGSLFGEDSVQSGGEISLDSATIIMKIRNSMRVLYSNGLFQPGGMIHSFLPGVNTEVVGIRKI